MATPLGDIKKYYVKVLLVYVKKCLTISMYVYIIMHTCTHLQLIHIGIGRDTYTVVANA